MHILKALHVKRIALILFIAIVNASCLFDKEIRQDSRLNFFRAKIHVIMDSLPKADSRIEAFDSMIVRINTDKDIISKRKRNILLTEVYYNIGNEYYTLKRYNKAIQVLSIPIEMNPDNAVAYYNRGCVYQSADSLQQAFKDYNQAIALNGDYADAYYNRGLLYEEQEEYESALTDFKKVVDLNPPYKPDALLKVGTIYQALNLDNKALECFDKAIKLDTSYFDGYFLKGELYISKNMPDSAIVQFDSILKRDSLNVYAFNKRAQLYESVGDIKNAREDYTEIIKIDSKNKTGLREKAREEIKDLNRVKRTTNLTTRKKVNKNDN